MMGFTFLFIGLCIVLSVVFDFELYWKLTRSYRRGYPAGKAFSQILHAGSGILFIVIGVSLVASGI